MRYLILLVTTLFTCYFTLANEIAITFDDLPAQGTDNAQEQMEINHKILNALKRHNAIAVGFVNEGKLYADDNIKEKIMILRAWTHNGNQLGNHTYSHYSLNNTNLADYQADVIKGEKTTKQIMNHSGLKLTYFRHPYLHTGGTPEIRQQFERFLNNHGYIVSPVTIDTDDWKFNRRLLKSPQLKEAILKEYLEHTKQKFIFYENASKKLFDRNIKHIWLLHTNLINAYAIDELLTMLKKMNYDVIPLEQALSDIAYQEPDSYYEAFGVSWLYRWDYTRGKVVNWAQEPETEE